VARLIILRGLPGSGKSTWAKEWVESREGHAVEVNRDNTRRALFGSANQDYYGAPDVKNREALVTMMCHADIEASLKADFDVVVSDTNLPAKRCRELARLGVGCGAEVESITFDTPLDECLRRNAERTDKEPVPEEVIRSMHRRFFNPTLAGFEVDVPAPVRRAAEYDPQLKDAIIVDTDGTVANHRPHRGPYETDKYDQDQGIADVVRVVSALRKEYDIIGVSGRSEEFRKVTEDWWSREVGFVPDAFYMRPAGDKRKDTVIKDEVYEKHIRGRYNIIGVIDDRPSVCRMWRAKGLTTFQVGDPHIEF